LARVQEELALQAPSLPMEQAGANLSNISCASNMPAMPMQPPAKSVQHEPELSKSGAAPSVNRRKDSVFSSLIYLISPRVTFLEQREFLSK
jgi:hypothetical protein